MNPFSHYDIAKPYFKAELKQAIDAVEQLKSNLNAST